MSQVALTPQEAVVLLEKGTVRLIDVREPSEYAADRLSQARNFPLGILQQAASDWHKEEPLLLYCQSGRRSAAAFELLQQHGFRELAHLQGGIAAWKEAGLQTERSEKAPWALDRQVRLAVGLFVLLFTGVGLTLAPAVLYLNLAIAAGLIFSALTNTCGLALVLTKMPWNRVRRSDEK